MKCVWTRGLVALGASLCLTVGAQAQINWDGGDGDWNDPDGKWNGGQTATEVFGRANGMEIGSGEVSNVVNIGSGTVTYDPNASGDFRFKPAAEVDGSTGARR